MRRAIVELIERRELRDLLRDRRTLFLVLILPSILYPVFGLVGFLFALTSMEQKIVVGVAGIEHLPTGAEYPVALSARIQNHDDRSEGDRLPRTIENPVALLGGGMLLAECERQLVYPPLIADGRFLPRYLNSGAESGGVSIVPLAADDDAWNALQNRRFDALLIVAPDFREKLERGERPAVQILGREGDETSKLAVRRLGGIVGRWQHTLKEARFARHRLPADFDETIQVVDPQEAKPVVAKTADELRDTLVKFLPFLLVMWTMAGALHPAIDLTAGEKERGTMETLLISPAERGEIVFGKFLAVWLFSYMSALCNLFWMGGAALVLSWALSFPLISLGGLAWAILFAMPLAAIFSALALGLGVFARSSKEGQYYLVPLFLIVMPLCLWSMTPGLKLSLSLSVVPITGLTLLLQRLMSLSAEPVSFVYSAGVFVSLLVCVGLSLWWAAAQFHKESVLFREAERLSLKGWVRSLFRR